MAIEEQFILLSIGLATIGVRVGGRWHYAGPANWELDDYLMPLIGVIFTAEVVAAYLVGAKFQGLTNSYMTDEHRAALDPDSREYFNRQWGSKIQVLGWSLYACILWLLKFCVAAFYSRLTSGLNHLKIRVQIAYVFLGATYLIVALTILLSCRPMYKFWQLNPDPGTLCRPTNSPAYVLVVVIPNILTDLYLLSIPLPLVWGVNISLGRRLTLMVLFSGALFIVTAGTIRAVVILKSGPEGAVSGSSWACRETFVAIVVTNLPVMQPVIRKSVKKIGFSTLFTRSTSTAAPSHELKSSSRDGGHRFDSKMKNSRYRHPLSIPQTNAWDSEEHILSEGQESKGEGVEGGDRPIIHVAQEIHVQSGESCGQDGAGDTNDPAHGDWRHKSWVTTGKKSYEA